jgi:hypothetical protein
VPRWLSGVHPKPQASTKKRTILLDITAGAMQPENFVGEVQHDIDSTDQEQDLSSDGFEDRRLRAKVLAKQAEQALRILVPQSEVTG